MDKQRLTMENVLDLLLQGQISAGEYAGFVLAPFLAREKRDYSGLLETLEAYFACNGNILRAAELLFIHRNTGWGRRRRCLAALSQRQASG